MLDECVGLSSKRAMWSRLTAELTPRKPIPCYVRALASEVSFVVFLTDVVRVKSIAKAAATACASST